MEVNHEYNSKLSTNAVGRTKAVLSFTDPLVDRYNAFGLIAWWRQDIVREATVMVVGAGALGNEVLKNLALMGIGRILIVDFDRIEIDNLSRSVLFRASDAGRFKAQVAAEAVQELNPDVEVQWLYGDINHDIGLGVYRRMDVVIGCLDNREARLSINRACWHLNKPWIDGAIQELLGIARVFRPNDGACYECTLTEEDYRIMARRESCTLLAHQNLVEGKVPTVPTISSIIAGIQVQEALKLLHGMPVHAGKALVFNGLTNDVYTVEYQEKEDCQSHWLYGEITELVDVRACSTTLGALLAIARDELDESAELIIPAFCEKAVCHNCESEVYLRRPRHCLTFDDTHCVECGLLMDIVTHTHERINGQESFLSLTLNEVGIPPLAVVPARTRDRRFKCLELTGDAESLAGFKSKNPERLETL